MLGTSDAPGIAGRLALAACLWSALLVAACDEGSEPCAPVGKVWCEGTTLMHCAADFYTGEPWLQEGIDCTDYGGTCVPGAGDEGTNAGCAIENPPCETPDARWCVSDEVLAVCQPWGFAKLFGCDGYPCVTTASGDGRCAYVAGQCTDGEQRCWPERSEHQYLECVGGAWSGHDSCGSVKVCYPTAPGEILCTYLPEGEATAAK